MDVWQQADAVSSLYTIQCERSMSGSNGVSSLSGLNSQAGDQRPAAG
jgi:hypothetical protein